jgi:hypothetical protein
MLAFWLSACKKLLWLGVFALTFGGPALVRAVDSTNAPSDFSQASKKYYDEQVLPILKENCFQCHSHAAEKIKGSLVLDSRNGLLKGGESGPAAVPGAPESSLLLRAVRQTDEDLKMPPKKKLSEAQVMVLSEWIKMGAPYSEREIAGPSNRKGSTAEHGGHELVGISTNSRGDDTCAFQR